MNEYSLAKVQLYILYMLYSSDDTHIKNRNATRATPRQDTMYTLSHGKGTSERKSVRITLEC